MWEDDYYNMYLAQNGNGTSERWRSEVACVSNVYAPADTQTC